MPLATKASPNCAKMQTKLSAWTPLNHPASNNKIFEERRSLVSKWFDRWSDRQRRLVLQDFLLRCSQQQLRFLSLNVTRQLPLQAADFTCTLPRALSLYVFSFLDPRSLSRCAQVSWHWRGFVELDQLWRPKCLKVGWGVDFSPSQLEHGAWKRLYVQRVLELRLNTKPKGWQQQKHQDHHVATVTTRGAGDVNKEDPPSSNRSASAAAGKKLKQPPPWRGSDPRPKDIFRNNYLDNLDPLQQGQLKSRVSGTTVTPGEQRKNSVTEKYYKLRKAKSLMFLTSNPRQPHSPLARGDDKAVVEEKTPQEDAGIRPGPVRPAVPKLSTAALRAAQRSHRSIPSSPLFQPWFRLAPHPQVERKEL
ncbi:F-box only protein 16 [Synchiropus splendidus]|uniref:F-box only protein 16 n=1 Tax=Synchiropus splendidus TaxID=270530 RepID=UPI00237EADDC|nr:F-box only protein 16 [Synchiropus splendidus]